MTNIKTLNNAVVNQLTIYVYENKKKRLNGVFWHSRIINK